MFEDICTLCRRQQVLKHQDFETDIYTVECPTCMTYRIEFDADVNVGQTPDRYARYLISGLCRKHVLETGNALYLSRSNIESIANDAPTDVADRTDALLTNLAVWTDRMEALASGVKIEGERDYPLAFCRNDAELTYFLRSLSDQGFINMEHAPQIVITPRGWGRVRELRHSSQWSNQGFVAMWFSDEMQAVSVHGLEV